MVNVVQRTFTFLETEEVLGGSDEIVFGQDAGIATFDAQLLVDLIATDAAEIIAFGIEEKPLDERASVDRSRRITWAQAPVDVLEGLFLVFGGIFLHALDDDPFIGGRIDHFD